MEPAEHVVGFDELRTRVRDAPVSLIARTSSERTFSLTVGGKALNDIGVSHLAGARHSVEQPHSNTDDDAGDNRLVHVQLGGESALVQDDRTAVLRPGDIAVYTASRPFSLDHGGESVIFRIPKRELQLPDGMVDELVGVRLARERTLVRVITPLVTQLSRSIDDLSGSSGRRVIQSAVGMVSAVVLETHQSVELAGPGRQLEGVLDYIDANLSRRELSVAEIATANFMSARKLHALFEQQDTTVAAFVRSRRLDRCRRDLADSEFAQLRISDIAARWGFRDAAHFSRLFADRFGASPRAFRSAASASRAPAAPLDASRQREGAVNRRTDSPPLASVR